MAYEVNPVTGMFLQAGRGRGILGDWTKPQGGGIVGSMTIEQTVEIGAHVKGFIADFREVGPPRRSKTGKTTVSMFSHVILSRCALQQGFECRIEFHQAGPARTRYEKSRIVLKQGGMHDRSATQVQAMRVPPGAESLAFERRETGVNYFAIAFSGASVASRPKMLEYGLDVDDSLYLFDAPVIRSMKPYISDNILYFHILGKYIVKPRCLISFGKQKCTVDGQPLLRRRVLLSVATTGDETDLLRATAANLHQLTLRERGLVNARSPHAEKLVADALRQARGSDRTDDQTTIARGRGRRRLGQLEPGNLEIDGCFGDSFELFSRDIVIFKRSYYYLVVFIPLEIQASAGLEIRADLAVALCFTRRSIIVAPIPQAGIFA